VKKAIHIAAVLLIVALLIAQSAQAQGTLYLSNLGDTAGAYVSIGSSDLIAQGFETGTDSGGYVLNSVQLGMAAASGNPSGFTVSVYSSLNGYPSADLGTLSGSSNPSSAGVYSYTTSGLTLAASTEYFVVAMAAASPSGSYFAWVANPAESPYTSVDDWSILPDFASVNGSAWAVSERTYGFQTGIYATAVPEHSTWILCLLGGGFTFYLRTRQRC